MGLEYLYDVAEDLDGALATYVDDINSAHNEIQHLDDLIDDRLKEIYSVKDPDMHNEYVADLREFVSRRRCMFEDALNKHAIILQELGNIEEKVSNIYSKLEDFDEHFPDFPPEDDVNLYCYMSD